jgi:GNAT superfamily N-acetyltransferase
MIKRSFFTAHRPCWPDGINAVLKMPADPTMSHTQREVDRYWAAEMGVGTEFKVSASAITCTTQQLYSGVQLFQRDGFLVVASPQHLTDFIAARIGNRPVAEIFSIEFVERLLGSRLEKILGPARVSYADRSTFRPAPTVSCRLLTPDDAVICRTFAAALSAADLEQSGFDPGEAPAFGVFAGGVLCAVASYQIWEPCIAHITVATHPDYRRCGHGGVAVSALAEFVFARNLILQHRSLASNENSLRLGRSLGFQQYCSTIYARLLEPV